jgi:ATP-dependent DNA helicase RecG
MAGMSIEKFIYQAESKTLEFKRDLSSMDGVLKTIIAFANTAGGVLIIGRSPDGTLGGVTDVFKAEEALANAIADNIRPTILPEIEIVTVSGHHLILVKVAYWRAPFYLKKEGFPKGIYIRLGSTSRPAGAEFLSEFQKLSTFHTYDLSPIPELSSDVLDWKLIEESFARVGKQVNEEKLKSLGVLVPFAGRLVPSIGGTILFGHEQERYRFIPEAKVSCARFVGEDKTYILDSMDIEGTILDAVTDVPRFIARNTRLSSVIEGMQRQDIPEYSPVAIREALMNALAHSDYSLQGIHTQIAIYSNRLEIQNAGTLPLGYTLDDFKLGVSRIRNRVVARVFHELKLMEEWGGGYKRITDACENEGYPCPEWKEMNSVMRVVFSPHPQTTRQEVPSAWILREEPTILNPRDEDILKLFGKGDRKSFQEIFQLLNNKYSIRTLRYDLARLKKEGLLSSFGKGRATFWVKK